jgi:DNA (cytosine-5)-methyltransferase 1
MTAHTSATPAIAVRRRPFAGRRVQRPTSIDVFAGCGGSSLGFRRAGFDVRAAIDNDAVSAASYQLNMGIAPLVRDVRSVRGRELLAMANLKRGELTALIACPPCQGFTSHRRETRAGWDPRNRLIEEFIRLVDETFPLFVVLENVPGLANGKRRWRLEYALRSLTTLGYSVAYDTVDAADYGTPQFRRRLLVIGSRCVEEVTLPVPTHAPPGHDDVRQGKASAWITVGDAIGSLAKLKSGETDPADPFHAARKHSPLSLERLGSIPHDGGSRDSLPRQLVLACHRTHDGHRDVYGRLSWDKPSSTLTSGCTNITRGRFAHPRQDRAITIREAMLLQGFPKYAKLAGTGEQRALQIGNAVPPPLAAAAARAVRRMLSEREKEGTSDRAPQQKTTTTAGLNGPTAARTR